jgi:hypothetical protein
MDLETAKIVYIIGCMLCSIGYFLAAILVPTDVYLREGKYLYSMSGIYMTIGFIGAYLK